MSCLMMLSGATTPTSQPNQLLGKAQEEFETEVLREDKEKEAGKRG